MGTGGKMKTNERIYLYTCPKCSRINEPKQVPSGTCHYCKFKASIGDVDNKDVWVRIENRSYYYYDYYRNY